VVSHPVSATAIYGFLFPPIVRSRPEHRALKGADEKTLVELL